MRNMPIFAMSKNHSGTKPHHSGIFCAHTYKLSFKYKDITAPCRDVEIPSEFRYDKLRQHVVQFFLLSKFIIVMKELIPNQKGMTSLEIAEVTGKRHDAILRDIRNLLKQGVAAHNFVETSYTDKSNRQSPCFNLTPKGCLILASGYDAVLRERIIDRLETLELGKPKVPNLSPKHCNSQPTKPSKSSNSKEQSSRKMQKLPNSSPKPILRTASCNPKIVYPLVKWRIS